MSSQRRGLVVMVLAVAIAAVIVAAHSGGSRAASHRSTAAPAGSALASIASSSSVTNFVGYVGASKPGKANSKLAPVQIGWINQQGGSVVIGGLATAGAELAVKYINTVAGGIDGHPVVLKTCFIQSTEQEGTTCGQQLRANKKISVIDEGAVVTGIQPFYSTIGGSKPVIAGVSVTPVDSVQKNTAILFGDVTHVLGPFGTYAKQVLHAKTAALVYPNEPGITDGAAAIKAGLVAEGITVKAVAYDPTTTDLIGPLTSAGASSADMVIPYTDAAGCVGLAKGLIQLGITTIKKIVSAPLCLNSQVAQALGGDFPKWTYAIASSLFGDPTDPGVAVYGKIAAQYGPAANAPDPWNLVAFGQLMTTAKLLNQIGYAAITPKAVLAAAKAFTGPQLLGAPSLQCGKYKNAPGVCNDKTQFFEYFGNHKFVKAASWLQNPS